MKSKASVTDAKRNASGYVLHETESLVVIATMESDNPKTGDMVQVFILRREMAPHVAKKRGEDTNCLDCPIKQACYVVAHQGPRAVWAKYARGGYEFLPLENYAEVFRGRKIRFGAYGEPVLIPILIVIELSRVAAGWTGYTHQWRKPEYRKYRPYLMASCDSYADAVEARAEGWRYFRVRAAGDFPLVLVESECPASEEQGHRTQCIDCCLCNGTRVRDARKNITIRVHGNRAGNFARLVKIGAAV